MGTTRYFLLMGFLATALPVAAKGVDQIAFTHVTVIDGTGSPVMPQMTVVVSGDRISAIGKADAVTVTDDVRVIDCHGKFMIPGLWDMHVHPRPWDSGFFLANGVTGGRSMHGRAKFLETRKHAGEMGAGHDGTQTNQDGGGSGIRVRDSPQLPILRSSVASPLLDGARVAYRGSISVRGVEHARHVVREIKGQGYDALNIHIGLPRDAYFAIVEEAKRQNVRWVGHVPREVTAWEVSDAGQSTIELLTGIYAACSSADPAPRSEFRLRDTYDQDRANELFTRFAENAIWHVPTLTVRNWLASADPLKLARDPRLKLLPRDTVSLWRAQAERIAGAPSIDFGSRRRAFAQDLKIVGQMHRSGVRIMAGTDCPNPFCLPGSGLHDELSFLVEAGLTPMESLQAATIRPAEYLGQLQDLGTVEQGKLADLVLLDADPLQDIDHVRNVAAVVFAGRYYSRRQLNDILAVHELEHAILELAESFSEQRLKKIARNELINSVAGLRIQDAFDARSNLLVSRRLGLPFGQDATLLLPKMSNLRELYLNDTDFNDIGLSRLSSLQKLETLEMDSTNITNEGLLHIANLRNLQTLSISHVTITDSGLNHLSSLANISTLRLAGTDITDAGFDVFRQFKRLKSLDLTNTTVTPKGVASFKLALPECTVSVSTTPQITASLVSPESGESFDSGAPVLLKATTREVGGAMVDRVDFLADDSIISTDSDYPYELAWAGATRGHHVITARVYSQTGTATDSQAVSVYVGVRGFETPVTSSANDVEEQEDGSIYADSSDLELTRDGNRGRQVIGLRFEDVAIPQGVKLSRAYIQFTAKNAGTAATNLVIRAQHSLDAAAFRTSEYDVSSRSMTRASVNWSPPSWTQPFEQSENQRTPDLSRIIQPIVSQDDWRTGNALVLIITGHGSRNAVAYDDDPDQAPRLHIEFEPR